MTIDRKIPDERAKQSSGPANSRPRRTKQAEESAATAVWIDEPLKRQRGTYAVYTVPTAGMVKFVALAPLQVILRHWLHGRSRPCVRPPAVCEGCQQGIQAEPKGFLLGLLLGTRERYLFELTEGAILSCAELQDQEQYVHHTILLKRLGARVNGKLQARVLDLSSLKLPPPPSKEDLRAAIMEIFSRRTRAELPLIDGQRPPLHPSEEQ